MKIMFVAALIALQGCALNSNHSQAPVYKPVTEPANALKHIPRVGNNRCVAMAAKQCPAKCQIQDEWNMQPKTQGKQWHLKSPLGAYRLVDERWAPQQKIFRRM